MDSIILLGQKNTLAEYMILSDTDNRPPMLDKDLYDLWKTDSDMKATNIILQGLPADIYSLERECKLYDAFDKFTHIKGESLHKYYLRFTQLINDMNIYNMKMEQFQVNTKFLNSFPPEWSLVVLVFSSGDDLIACLNKAMAFLTAVASSRFPSTNNQLRTSSNPRNQAIIQDGRCNATSSERNNASGQSRVVTGKAWYKDKAMLVEAQEAGQILDEEQLAFLADPGVPNSQAIQTIIPNNVAFQTEDLDTYDSDCDDISNAKAVIEQPMARSGIGLEDIQTCYHSNSMF
ncbi:hypothetical protein Tco_0138497 [Tanacetum coccineum]